MAFEKEKKKSKNTKSLLKRRLFNIERENQ